MEARVREASDLRETANRVFRVTGDAVKAEQMYTRCIELDGADWMAHSNRAAVRSQCSDAACFRALAP